MSGLSKGAIHRINNPNDRPKGWSILDELPLIHSDGTVSPPPAEKKKKKRKNRKKR